METYKEHIKAVKMEREMNSKHTFETLSEGQKGWLAGILDGEGWIGIVPNPGYKHIARIQIAMTHEETIKVINEITCNIGNVYTRRRHEKERTHHSQIWNIDINVRSDIYALLKVVLPYMITKRAQALLVVEYTERRMTNIIYGERDIQIIKDITKLNQHNTDAI